VLYCDATLRRVCLSLSIQLTEVCCVHLETMIAALSVRVTLT
jgi:hypothetical protein